MNTAHEPNTDDNKVFPANQPWQKTDDLASVQFEDDDFMELNQMRNSSTKASARNAANPVAGAKNGGTASRFYWGGGILLLACAGLVGHQVWKRTHPQPYTSSLGVVEVVPQLVVPQLAPVEIPAAAPSVATGAVTIVTPPESPEKVIQAELLTRIEKAEQANKKMVSALRSKGYIKTDPNSTTALADDWLIDDLLPYGYQPPAVVVAKQVAPATAPRRVVKPAIQTPAVEKEAKTVNQLLSVDWWGGRPSVVIGSGQPGDKRVVVLQQGDTYNGATLKSVDVTEQRVTFSVNGREVSMGLTQGGQ